MLYNIVDRSTLVIYRVTAVCINRCRCLHVKHYDLSPFAVLISSGGVLRASISMGKGGNGSTKKIMGALAMP